jgi:hypothetical protein
LNRKRCHADEKSKFILLSKLSTKSTRVQWEEYPDFSNEDGPFLSHSGNCVRALGVVATEVKTLNRVPEVIFPNDQVGGFRGVAFEVSFLRRLSFGFFRFVL